MWFQVKRCFLFIRKDVLTEHVTIFQISTQKSHSSTHKVLLAHDEKRQIGCLSILFLDTWDEFQIES